MMEKPYGQVKGPITLSYELKKKNELWGWELQTIATENADFLPVLRGERLGEDYLKK